MKIFNTLSRQKEEFVPLEPGKVKMYVCGPTVYNYIHIGNARPMIVFDTVRRYFEYKGYEVNYVSNFTDIDDKIINRALEEGVDASVISERFIAECKKDMAGLNVKPATTHPQATKEIEGMLSMIHTLIETGHAYVAADGTVYFRTASFPDYGKLSHKNLDELQSGFREIKVTGEEGKEAPADFVLWKPKKEGEPYWESPWCQGRPGWHIECSVMAKRYLGDEIDIHAGGEDLIFPHHENEIAQSECANGKPFAKYWMHNGFLNIDNKKMSKSLGNFFTVREISERYDLQVLRFFMLSAHYRSPLNFSEELMEASKNGLERIRTAVERLSELEQKAKEAGSGAQGTAEAAGEAAADNAQGVAETAGKTVEASAKTAAETARKAVDDGMQVVCGRASAGQENTAAAVEQGNTAASVGQMDAVAAAAAEQENTAVAQELVAKYEAAMDDDFNTADAISAVFELVKLANSTTGEGSSAAYISYLKETIEKLCDVMGIITEAKHEALDAEIEAMIEERQAARKAKNYALADEIRGKLSDMGIILEDTRQGVKWRRA